MNIVTAPPPYPLDAHFLIVSQAIEEVMRHVQAPDGLVAMEFLTNMSASAQGLYDVRLPTGQVRPLSLNLLVVAESGERKTAVHNLIAAPLYAFDQACMSKYEADLKKYELHMSIWKSVDAGLRRQITKQTQEGQLIDDVCCRLSEHAANKPRKPRLRRIMRQNATERAIMDALEGDGESIAFISDEGEIIIKGGALSQTGPLNKAWDGTSMLALDRSDDVSIVVRNPRVTISYMVQPQVLNELLNRRGTALRGCGHLARYVLGFPASTQGTRFTYRIDHAWCRLPMFHARMQQLLDEWGRRIEAGMTKRVILEFEDDAIPRWFAHANQIEAMMSPSDYLHDIKDFASKVMEITGRVAALLHVFSAREGKISVDTLDRAVSIIDWHMNEFKRIFSNDHAVPQEQADAQVLEHYLYTHYWSRNQLFVQKNLVLRNGPVRPASRLDAALHCLISAGGAQITVGPRRERYINLNSAYFMALSIGAMRRQF